MCCSCRGSRFGPSTHTVSHKCPKLHLQRNWRPHLTSSVLGMHMVHRQEKHFHKLTFLKGRGAYATSKKRVSKQVLQIANILKKGSTASAMQSDMQIKITLEFHFTPVRMPVTNTNSKCQHGCGEMGDPFTMLGRVQSGATSLETNLEIPQKLEIKNNLMC